MADAWNVCMSLYLCISCVSACVFACVCMSMSVQAHVRIWNSVNLNTLKVLGLGVFDRAVSCLSFSKLVCVHFTPYHRVMLVVS